jgi:hypothetical protein
MRLRHHIKRLETQASRHTKDLEAIGAVHRALRARALAAALVVEHVEALLACAEALAAAGDPDSCPGSPVAAAADYNLLAAASRGEVLRELSPGLAAAGAPLPRSPGPAPQRMGSSASSAAAASASTAGGSGGSGASVGAPSTAGGTGSSSWHAGPGSLHVPQPSWWPGAAGHLEAARRIASVDVLRRSSFDLAQAAGVLLP